MKHSEGNFRNLSHKLIKIYPSLYILFNRKNNGIKNTLLNLKAYNSIKKNFLFDPIYYLNNYPDVKNSGLDPLIHYFYHGFKESRKPNPSFDGKYYNQRYEDVKRSNMNPLIHYSLYGIKEGRKTKKNLMEISENKFEDDNTNLRTVPHYPNLKKTLKGNNGYLFLINDSNYEMRQHFDVSYTNNFNADIFIENLSLKKEYINQKNIRYYFFIIPDKSLLCYESIPFEVKIIKRNYDSNSDILNSLVPDFIEFLDNTCYHKNDSHINYLGGKELSYYYLNYIDKDFNRKIFYNLIDEQISIVDKEYDGDLTTSNEWGDNWSYSDEEKEEHLNENITVLKNKCLMNLNEEIPDEFRTVGIRETEYYKNPKGWTGLRVLILRDSSTEYLQDILSIYFKEILLYWDHGIFNGFNRELVEWYKPDIILDIRTERLLENLFNEFKK